MAPEILDTDLFVVNRDDVTYKVSAEDLNLTGPKPINPGPDQIQIDPSVPGTGTELDPFILSPVTVSFGGSGVTVEEITISGEKGGDLVIFIDEEASINGSRFSQPIGTIVDGSDYKTRLRFSDVPESTVEQEFVGKLRLAETQIHFRWAVTVEAGTEVPVLNAVTLVGTGTDTSKRFEDQSFHTTLDIDEGKPVSTKSIAYKVAGTLSVTPTTSEIVGEDKVTVPGGWTSQTVTHREVKAIVHKPGGKYVMVGYDGLVSYSDTGVGGWTDITVGSSSLAHSMVLYVPEDDIFVGCSGSGQTAGQRIWSTDGVSWNTASQGTVNLYGMTYGNGKYVIVGSKGAMWGSTSATTNYVSKTSNASENLRSVVYSSELDLYVVVGDRATLLTSTDAETWVSRPWTLGDTPNLQEIVYGDGKFVVCDSTYGRIYYSTDAITWFSGNISNSVGFKGLTYAGGKFLAVGNNGVNATSVNGIDWVVGTPVGTANIECCYYDGSQYFAAGVSVLHWSPSGQDSYETQTLTLADNTDLAKFTAGELVKQNAPVVQTNIDAYSTTLYPGTGVGNIETIPTGINNTDKSLIWTKKRTGAAQYHVLTDTVRGPNSRLKSDSEAAAEAKGNGGTVAFLDNGFTVGGDMNQASENYVAWNFRALSKFFDIQTWSGNSVAGRKIPHQLGSVPGMMIVKSITSGEDWMVYHQDVGATQGLKLNENEAAGTSSAYWNNTDPTSTNFTVGLGGQVNASGNEYIAYLFAETPGTIQSGSYFGVTGTQSITTGFKPGWLLVKRTDDSSDWVIVDAKRKTSSGTHQSFFSANTGGQEDLSNNYITFTDTGFTVTTQLSSPGSTHVYVAIKENAVADLAVTPAGLFQTYDDTTNPAAPTMTLTPQVDGWSANTGKRAIGEENVSNNATLYLETNTLRQVTGTSSAPVYYDTTATTDEITFDLPPGTGQSWDDELPDGTTIEACAHADNTAGGGGRSPLSGDICSTKLQPEANDPYGPALGGLTTLYPGTGAAQTITNGINLADKGGLVWTKVRTEAYSHALYDTLRGPQNVLQSQTTIGQQTFPGNGLSAFNDDGFDIGGNQSWSNAADKEYVAWTFQKAPGYFDIQTWSGGSTGGSGGDFTLPHSLGAEVGFVIVKNLSSSTENWQCYHKELGTTNSQGLYLNEIDGVGSTAKGTNPVKSTSTTEIEIRGEHNVSGSEYIAYLFADTLGTIKCGTYEGTGANQSIPCEFRPQWVLTKNVDRSDALYNNWVIVDEDRHTGDPATGSLRSLAPNSNVVEGGAGAGSAPRRFTDDGFDLDGGVQENSSGDTFIYVAIAAPVVRNLTQEEVNATKLLFETKDYRQAKYEQDLVSRASSLRANFEARGFTTAEIDAVLNPDVTPAPETPVAISGYYPLYTTESASNAAGDGTSHTHEFDGVTYYMPNGVTFYHGDYGSGY